MLQETNTKFRTDLRNLITQEPCSFASETVKSWQDQKNEIEGFVIDKVCHENAQIDVNDVVGSNHAGYIGNPWSYLILSGHKSQSNLTELCSDPEYYLSSDLKDDLNFKKVNGDIYIIGDGNNRTTIAKFFFHFNKDKVEQSLLKGVHVEELLVDWTTLHVKDEIEALLESPRFEHLTLKLSPEYSADQEKVYRWHLYNKTLKGGVGIKLTRHQLPELLDGMKSDNFFSRFFGLGYSKDLRKSDIFCLR